MNLFLFNFHIFKFGVCSLNWQHQLCKNPKPNPDIRTLFVDHTCGQSSGGPRVASPVTNPLLAPVPKVGAFTSIGGHGVSFHQLISYGGVLYF